ncbi:MAG TPA: radical SAM protein [Povalibacter sp.]|nr:radical SAM protein [Povalibacter sp.]
MLSVLVAHSYFLRLDQKQWQRAKPYPPLATLQVAASLRQAGHSVSFFDAMLADGVGAYEAQLGAGAPQLALFYEDNFNFLSKMCLGRMREAACLMVRAARRAGSRVIVAGSDASDAPQEYLAAGADVVLLGEGLSILPLLLQRLESDAHIDSDSWTQGLHNVATLVDAEAVVRKGPAHLQEQQQPIVPAWDLIDVESYRSVWREARGYFSLNMAASRGCSFRCNWCAKPIWGNRYLQRPAEEVAAEMAHLKRTLRPDHIWFADDIFGFRVDWVRKFAAAVHAVDGSIPFTIQTRADLVSEEMAKALAEARCMEVWLGAESGSQKILDAMHKGTTVADIGAASERLRAAGIRVAFFIQLGYLDEQLEDILATRQLIERLRPDDIGVSVSYPLPGTPFYEMVRHQLRSKTHWQESNDLSMMFEGTYSSDFYRDIRNLLHEQIAVEQLNERGRFTDYARARADLQSRWDALICDEERHRSGPRAVAAGT